MKHEQVDIESIRATVESALADVRLDEPLPITNADACAVLDALDELAALRARMQRIDAIHTAMLQRDMPYHEAVAAIGAELAPLPEAPR